MSRAAGHGTANRQRRSSSPWRARAGVLKTAVCSAKLGRDEELQALRRLDAQARQLERTATGPSLDTFIAGERGRAAALDGRSVFGWEKDLARLDKTGVD